MEQLQHLWQHFGRIIITQFKEIIMSRTNKNDAYHFTHTWGNSAGRGRYIKRQLSKARRRFWKSLVRFGRGKSPSNYESETNWKGW